VHAKVRHSARLAARGELFALQAQQLQGARQRKVAEHPEGRQPQQHHLHNLARAPGHGQQGLHAGAKRCERSAECCEKSA
jgi:hypothetical protein